MSKHESSSAETCCQAGEHGGQQGRQRQGQQPSRGLGPENLALPPGLQGPDIVCHFQFLLVVVIQLLRECQDLWKAQGSAGRDEAGGAALLTV